MLSKDDQHLLTGRVEDLIHMSGKRQSVVNTEFLDMAESSLVRQHLEKAHVPHFMWGGYEDAERCLAVLWPASIKEPEKTQLPMTYLKVSPKTNPYVRTPGHRDYLGALMNLGLERRVVGDILMQKDGCVIICVPHIVEFLLANFDRVGRCPVDVMEIDSIADLTETRQYKQIKDTVSSLRLDSIVKVCARISRGDSLTLIKSGRVFVDGYEINKASHDVTVGNILSIRGYGKFKLTNVGHRTKKDRLVIEIDQYL